jgi:membrane-bound lytic murein transglycosylase MltF
MKPHQILKSTLVAPLLCLFFILGPVPGNAPQAAEVMSTADMAAMNKPFFGDFDEMAKDRVIRVLMPYSKTFYFFDGAKQRGLSYEMVKKFEEFVNKKLKTGTIRVEVFVIPTARKELIPKLTSGIGDIAIGNLTITKERLKEVDFSIPGLTNVSEILVTAKQGETFTSVFDLAGKTVHVRESSSYYHSLLKLNKTLKSVKKPKVKIELVDDNLEDEDLLEMVNAGLLEHIIIDKHKGEFWVKIFENIKLHPEVKVRSGGKIGWAFRKKSPKLEAVINEFMEKHKAGTLIGNIMLNRYLKDTAYITDSLSNEHLNRFKLTSQFFEKYGDEYNFDHLMLAALAYQESKLNQNLKSRAGAVGVMQILPSTAKDKNVGIPNIYELDPNIHAGTKYLRFMTNQYFADDPNLDPLNRTFFAFASYNAGPARVAKMRRKAKEMGLDPNVWFKNVEIVAAKEIGRETVQYVSNIFKYYIAYKLLEDKLIVKGPVHITDPPKKKRKKGQ